MGITAKFNLILITVLGAGFTVIGLTTHRALYNNADHEVLQQAGLMMDSAKAVRRYTIDEISPLLVAANARKFLPQSVPAYAATQSFLQLHKTHPQYTYKEATINPTNPRDRAVGWESDIITMFQNHPKLKQFSGERQTPDGPSLYLARPIRVNNEACLSCHGSVAAAPKTMIQRYGTANGFGWQFHSVVGAQIVTVPMKLPVDKARATFRLFMTVLGITFVAIVVITNLLLKLIVINPIRKMSQTADQVSQGKMQAPEFQIRGTDELSVLAASFNRMRRSLVKAMSMLDPDWR